MVSTKTCLTHFNIPASRQMLSVDVALALALALADTTVEDSERRAVWLLNA